MTATMKSLGIDRLPPDQQIALALEIWDSLGANRPHGELTAEQGAEMARRDAELDANPGMGMTWEKVLASLGEKP